MLYTPERFQTSDTTLQRRGAASILQSAGQLAEWFIKAKTIASLDLLPPSTEWAQNLAEQGFWGFLHGILWLSSYAWGTFMPSSL